MKKISFLQLFLASMFFLMACGQVSAPPPAPTSLPAQPTTIVTQTPDPCAPENMTEEVRQVNNLMRTFDDASAVASSTPQDNLGTAIAELQRLRRLAEEQQVPTCLETLKKLQVDHMNIVIETTLAFLNNSDQAVINDGINRARAAHDLYSLEVAKLLGLTLVPITPTVMLPVETSTPGPTITPTP